MEVQNYLATLGVRPAELSGLKELPGETKDRITPVLLLAPWLATTPLTRALDKFEESFPSRPYFVDVDTFYRANEKMNEAKEVWMKLAQRPSDVSAWWQLLEGYPNAHPCLLMANQTLDGVKAQINWARKNGRSFGIRMNFADNMGARVPEWMPILIDELAEEGTIDYAIIFEFGWVSDPLSKSAIAGGLVNGIFSAIPPQVPIAISCTSFPKDFTGYDGKPDIAFTNRELIAQVRQKTNHPLFVYGDWASTKPRSYGHASPPKRRIDYPTKKSWVFARDKGDSVDFQIAAKRIVESEFWSGKLGVWGEQLIESTAEGQPFAIDTMPKMYSVRINIHLHLQAFFDGLPLPSELDETWSDDDF